MIKNVFVPRFLRHYLYIIIMDKVKANKRKLILLSHVILLTTSIVTAQVTVWPGDVNNNGEVNNIDMLYWGLAKDATGPARAIPSSDWDEQTLDDLWTESFADGTNFGYADCNGDGVVNDDDLDVIKDNFSLEAPVVDPDIFDTGNPASDPILLLDPITTEIDPNDTSKISLSLGDMANEIDSFFGIAFTLNFNPDLVQDQMMGNNPKVFIDFLEDDNWINQNPPNHARIEIEVDNEAGEAQVAIFRRNPGTNSGGGEFGILNIVMVDIVLFTEPAIFSVDKIKMVDPELGEMAVAPSETEVLVLGDSTTTTFDELYERELKIYPNPIKDDLWIEVIDDTNEIEKIELYNTLGQMLYSKEHFLDKQQSQLSLIHIPPGMYLVRIDTAKGVFTKLITR